MFKIMKMRIVYEGILLRLLLLLMACSSNDSSTTDPSLADESSKEQNMSAAAMQRRDSLLTSPSQLLSTIDSLYKTGAGGTDSLKIHIEGYKYFISNWFTSELDEEMKLCPDVKKIFSLHNTILSDHIENYTDLLSKINSKLPSPAKDCLIKKYQLQLSQDISQYLQPLLTNLYTIDPEKINKSDVFCPETFSREKEKELKGKPGKEKELQETLARFKASPIVQTYNFYKKRHQQLADELTALNRRYYLFF